MGTDYKRELSASGSRPTVIITTTSGEVPVAGDFDYVEIDGYLYEKMTIKRPSYEQLEAENMRLREAILWALGEIGEFPPIYGAPYYAWRTELRDRAGREEWDL